MPHQVTETLKLNLLELDQLSPELASRLRLPVSNDHVREEREGGCSLRLGRSWVPLDVDTGAVIRPGDNGEPVLVFGVGLGETVACALAAGREVLAWDRDPWLIRLFLSRYDVRGALRAGQLKILLGTDLLDIVPFCGPTLPHPVLTAPYHLELDMLERGLGPRRALLCRGELFVDDLADALKREGFTVWPWEIHRHAREEVVHAARTVGAELALAVNLTHGLGELCRELDLPLLCWEVDPATDRPVIRGPSEHAHIFTYRAKNVQLFRDGGFRQVRHLPLATNTDRRRPPAKGTTLAGSPPPVSFVGSSMVEQVPEFRERFHAAWRSWRPTGDPREPQPLLDRLLAVQRSETERYLVPELMDLHCPGWRAAAVASGEADPAVWVGEIAAAEKRLNVLARLGGMDLRVWGDPGWRLLEQAGARYMGRAGHGEELTRIYAESTVNVDVGRLYQNDIVPMRVFDVLAVGGFLLAEWTEALGELFQPGRDLETWRTPEELVEKVGWYLAHPDTAAKLARQGRERVLAEHTISRRLGVMLQAVVSPPSGAPPPRGSDPGAGAPLRST